jgi:hypothetical protein
MDKGSGGDASSFVIQRRLEVKKIMNMKKAASGPRRYVLRS